eukprot:TRINITY_DN10908_c0_g2_i1.p1 TRINITY_DN10908_c0_g2~~TRINITY_DN10908_c0_g2_i1.p1  ORF type:complete len:120 (-),score=10.46 TRINITY_DN10908_c0_g2_i1:249-608(-)
MQQGLSIIVDGEEGVLQRRLYFFSGLCLQRIRTAASDFARCFALQKSHELQTAGAFSPIYQVREERQVFYVCKNNPAIFLIHSKNRVIAEVAKLPRGTCELDQTVSPCFNERGDPNSYD